MRAELTPAAVALVVLLAALLVHDGLTLARHRRVLAIQAAAFAAGALLIVFPEIARRLAHAVGIGRGVDFVLYPLVIWLVRESLLSRRRYHEQHERLTEMCRAVAMLQARDVRGESPAGRVGDPARPAP